MDIKARRGGERRGGGEYELVAGKTEDAWLTRRFYLVGELRNLGWGEFSLGGFEFLFLISQRT